MNSLAASQSGGRISSLVTPDDKLAMTVEDPLAVVAGNHFEGKFTEQPSESSLNYINLPRGRRIVPVDALSWVSAFNAGYEPRLDCTAVRILSLGCTPRILSCTPFTPVHRVKRRIVLLGALAPLLPSYLGMCFSLHFDFPL